MRLSLRSVVNTLKIFRKFLRDGGVVQVNIAQINHGGILTGKTVLVTGGGSGIGLAIAKKCLAEGAVVVISGRHSEKLEMVCTEINHPLLKPFVWDVSDISIVKEKLVEARELARGNIDILINNAGIYSDETFLGVTEESWDAVHDSNIKGLFFVCQEISRHWIDSKKTAKIINIASIAGICGAVGPYWTSKWGVVGLTRGIGKRLCSKGIIVNAIAPGIIGDTGMNPIRAKDNAYSESSPNNRIGFPEEVAELALFLASDATNHIVGQTIVCDGGNSLN